jgi:hypothetical protein
MSVFIYNCVIHLDIDGNEVVYNVELEVNTTKKIRFSDAWNRAL